MLGRTPTTTCLRAGRFRVVDSAMLETSDSNFEPREGPLNLRIHPRLTETRSRYASCKATHLTSDPIANCDSEQKGRSWGHRRSIGIHLPILVILQTTP